MHNYVMMLKSDFIICRGNPAGTQRCFNVHLSLNGRYERYMNVVLTFCASWEFSENKVCLNLHPYTSLIISYFTKIEIRLVKNKFLLVKKFQFQGNKRVSKEESGNIYHKRSYENSEDISLLLASSAFFWVSRHSEIYKCRQTKKIN